MARDTGLQASGQEETRLFEGADPVVLAHLAQVALEVQRELVESRFALSPVDFERAGRGLEAIEGFANPGLGCRIAPARLVEGERNQDLHLLEDLAHGRARVVARRVRGRRTRRARRELGQRDPGDERRENDPADGLF